MKVLEELDKAVAVLLGRHFVYKSGKHGSAQFFPERKLKALRKFREQLQAIEKIWQSET